MNLVQLTPGTGNFYCGACIRDNALAAALVRQGHHAVIIPLYLPMVTDEPGPSNGQPILFGGLNAYLQQRLPLFRKTPRWIDQMFDGERLLAWLSNKAGMTRAQDLGEMTLSSLRGEKGNQFKEIDRLVEWIGAHLSPDIVCLSNCLLVGLARRLKAELKVPVVCTLQGEDGFLDSLPEPYRQDCWDTLIERAVDIDLFIPVSEYYGQVMRKRMNLPSERMRPVRNGILLDGYSPSERPFDPPVLGYLARLYPVKGLQRSVETFIRLKERGKVPGLRLRLGGTATPTDMKFVNEMKSRLERAGVIEDVELFPNLSRQEKIQFLSGLTVFSVPAVYGESFGLYVIEAMAAGVPVVQPRSGAFPELLEATGGGIVFDPDESESHVEAIEDLLLDVDKLTIMGENGRKAVHEKFSVDRMAGEMSEILEDVKSRHVAV